MTTTYFIADLHLGHARIIDIAQRPFVDVVQMDEILVALWNATVGPEDTVYFLGDFAWKGSLHRFRNLNGKKHLVRGNHDTTEVLKLGWKSVQDHFIGEIKGIKFHLSHYPLRSWASQWRGAVHLHGHSHNTLPPVDGALDVGVESLNYRPISIDQVHEKFSDWINRSTIHD